MLTPRQILEILDNHSSQIQQLKMLCEEQAEKIKALETKPAPTTPKKPRQANNKNNA
jgi:hypothetical protein